MNAQEILELIRAGYTKAEIEALETPAAAPDPKDNKDTEPAKTPAAAPDPEGSAAPEPAAQPENNAGQDVLKTAELLRGAMEQFTKQLQSFNVATASQGAAAQPETLDDIMAKIINPPGLKGGK